MDQYLSEYYTPDLYTQPSYTVTILTPELVGSNPEGFEEYRNKTRREAMNYQIFGAIEVYVSKNWLGFLGTDKKLFTKYKVEWS